MSGSEHARPVWLTKEQRDWLTKMGTLADRHGFFVLQIAADEMAAAWDAAPADPTEALAKLLARDWYGEEWCDLDDETRLDHFEKARDVLRALGCAKDPA